MSRSMIRTAAAAAALALAPLATAHAQDAFAPGDAGGAVSGAEAPEGKVVRVEGVSGPSESLYRYVARTHATWLASRGPHEFPMRSHVVVYRDGVPLGGTEVLRGIPAGTVVEMRRMDPSQASRHFGVEHGAGAILLTSK